MTAEQLRDLQLARQRMKRIARAVSTGKFDGWTLAVFGGCTAVFGLMSFSLVGMLIGTVLCVIAIIELREVDRLARLEPRAARILCYNQLALGGSLVVYAVWNLLAGPLLSPELKQSSSQLQDLGIDVAGMMHSIYTLVYWGLIAIAIAAQGSMALFYLRREKMVKDYAVETPAWIAQLQQAGMRV